MKPARPIAALALLATLTAGAQMHKVEKADTVTRAVGVYEYVGDLNKPRAARFIPVSLFIGGHFEDAGVYMARPIPFALSTGFRYELMEAGVRKQFLDLVAARNFAGSSSAAATPFDDGWAGYGRVAPLPKPKAARLRPNCGNAHVVQEVDNSKPHFGNRTADPKADTPKADPKSNPKADSKNDPCRDPGEDDRPEKVTLDDAPKDKNAPDPERPTLHRSPETTANNTGAAGKPDKKAPKPPPATITANGGPGDDPDRPTIRHRTTDEDDPNNLPPDPLDLASREAAARAAGKSASAGDSAPAAASAAATANTGGNRNDTTDADATITAGNTMGGGPVLRRGRLTQPTDDPATAPTVAASPLSMSKAASATKTAPTAKPGRAAAPAAPAAIAPPALPPARDSIVAVSDAKDRAAHDFTYHFASVAERAAVLETLEGIAQAVLANPALATDANEAALKRAATALPAASAATHPATSHAAGAKTTATRTARTRLTTPSGANAKPPLADEQMNAYQLYYSAPVSYTFTARTPATVALPERYVTVIATTNAEGKLEVAFRSTTDSAHLDRTPRYRLIDVVDADASNRAELLMEIRAQHSRQFALYRLLCNKPDQVFITGSTLL